MNRTSLAALACAGLVSVSLATAAFADTTVMVGGQQMFPSKDIVDNAVNSADHTTLVAAVKAAGLVAALKGPGPLTVFAPTNAAFTALPAGTVDMLLKPENKTSLTKILTYHVVAGDYTAGKLRSLIRKNNGTVMLKTLAGGTLTAMMNGPNNIALRDEKGNVADITVYDVTQSNGVIQVVDKVLMPAS